MKQIATITGENLNVVVKNVEASAKEAPTQKKTKAEKRMDTLRALGYDMSKYFTLGDEQVVEIKDGKAVPVDFVQIAPDEDDVVEKKLVEGGYVNNWKLFRRWVMSQMFHMLRDMEKYGKSFNEVLQHKSYEYQWRMLENEAYAQMKMQKHGDSDNAKMRNMWFNGEVASDMAADYISKLKAYVDDNLIYRVDKKTGLLDKEHYKHTCHGLPYVRINNKNIFVADLQKKVYAPLYEMASTMCSTASYEVLYRTIKNFNKVRKHLYWNTKQSNDFINAYKGSGSYFTMRNLIMFHGVRFRIGGKFTSEAQSLKHLDILAKDCVGHNEGWRMLGILKELISESGISIQGKIDEWNK